MNLTINDYRGLHLLLAEGALEEKGLEETVELIEKLPLTLDKYIILDCSGIRKLIHSSTGFSGFINHLHYLRSRNTKITLYGYDQLVYNLIKLLKLESMFSFTITPDDAYLSLNPILGSVSASNTVAQQE